MNKKKVIWDLTDVERKLLEDARKKTNKADIACNKFYRHVIERFYHAGYDGYEILNILLASDVYVVANSGDCSSDEDRVWESIKQENGVEDV